MQVVNSNTIEIHIFFQSFRKNYSQYEQKECSFFFFVAMMICGSSQSYYIFRTGNDYPHIKRHTKWNLNGKTAHHSRICEIWYIEKLLQKTKLSSFRSVSSFSLFLFSKYAYFTSLKSISCSVFLCMNECVYCQLMAYFWINIYLSFCIQLQ